MLIGTVEHEGALPSGSRYLIEVPKLWNGVVLLFRHPVPVTPDEPPWDSDPLVAHLVGLGYAVAGSANTIFWPLELAFADHHALLEVVGRALGPARHTIALGQSIGGLISAGLVQRFPGSLSGALAMCGNMAGAVATHNRELDIAFVVKTLIAPRSDLQITGITDPYANLRCSRQVLEQAQAAPSARARLALAAAIGNVPGWHDPATDEPPPEDHEGRQQNQHAWFREICFLVFFWAREQVERQAGGNPSWNTDVDYCELLAGSTSRDVVESLYAAAGLDLDRDLERLGAEPRIAADPAALDYLERHIVLSGDLGGVPVLTLHTDGDGLVTPDHQQAYADVVNAAGQQDLLRQLFIHRAGHCTMTLAEVVTALDALIERIEGGSWPHLGPRTLNDATRGQGAQSNVLVSGRPAEARFFDFDPPPFTRRYDIRDVTAALR